MIDAHTMRDTLRLWASGVAVVTTQCEDQRAGMTVSAFNSLSLEPPLILVCLYKTTTTAKTIHECGHFAVSFLSEDQAYIADRFAGRVPLQENEDRFDGIALHTAVTGAPVLSDALAWLDCRVEQVHDGSTHWIVIGEVMAAGRRDGEAPLVYFNRNYRSLMLQTEHS